MARAAHGIASHGSDRAPIPGSTDGHARPDTGVPGLSTRGVVVIRIAALAVILLTPALHCGCAARPHAAQPPADRPASAVDLRAFRAVDIARHSAPHDLMIRISVPTDTRLRRLCLKIYPVAAHPPRMLVAFIRDLDGYPAETPYDERPLSVPDREGLFEYDWSVDAAIVDLADGDHGRMVWLRFREESDDAAHWHYNCQVAYGSPPLIPGMVTTGLTLTLTERHQYIGTIPHGFTD